MYNRYLIFSYLRLCLNREHTYELSRIRRPAGSTSSPSSSSSSPSSPVVLKPMQQQQITASIQPITPTTTYQHQHSANNLHANALYQAASLSSAVVAAANIIQPLVEAPPIVAPVQQPRKLQNAASKSQLKASSGSSSTKNQERRLVSSLFFILIFFFFGLVLWARSFLSPEKLFHLV